MIGCRGGPGGARPPSREEVKEVDLADPIRAGGGGGWGWGDENPKISDRWFSATSAPFSMILDVLECSSRVLFVSDVIFHIYESVGGRPPVGGRSKARPSMKNHDFR